MLLPCLCWAASLTRRLHAIAPPPPPRDSVISHTPPPCPLAPASLLPVRRHALLPCCRHECDLTAVPHPHTPHPLSRHRRSRCPLRVSHPFPPAAPFRLSSTLGPYASFPLPSLPEVGPLVGDDAFGWRCAGVQTVSHTGFEKRFRITRKSQARPPRRAGGRAFPLPLSRLPLSRLPLCINTPSFVLSFSARWCFPRDVGGLLHHRACRPLPKSSFPRGRTLPAAHNARRLRLPSSPPFPPLCLRDGTWECRVPSLLSTPPSFLLSSAA